MGYCRQTEIACPNGKFANRLDSSVILSTLLPAVAIQADGRRDVLGTGDIMTLGGNALRTTSEKVGRNRIEHN